MKTLQLCPKCNGQGIVSKPPYVPGDVNQWIDTEVSHQCNLCNGEMVIEVDNAVDDDIVIKENIELRKLLNVSLVFHESLLHFVKAQPNNDPVLLKNHIVQIQNKLS